VENVEKKSEKWKMWKKKSEKWKPVQNVEFSTWKSGFFHFLLFVQSPFAQNVEFSMWKIPFFHVENSTFWRGPMPDSVATHETIISVL
jgi:hypothetical protein